MLRNLLPVLVFILIFPVTPAAAEPEPTVFTKIFPSAVVLETAGKELDPLAVNGNYRAYSLPADIREITLSAEGYESKRVHVAVTEGALLEEKLERRGSRLDLLTELPSGNRPKSAAFSPDGAFLVVPLLNDAGIDLYGTDPFRYIGMITVPEPYASSHGFVEPVFIIRRNELWVSQMTTGMIHVFDTETWEWRAAYPSGGTWPKVLTLSPDGRYCSVSNWKSQTVSFLETETGRIRATVSLGGVPRGTVFSSDGEYLYVCLFDTGDIEIIDCRNFIVSDTLKLGPGAARHIAADYGADRLYVTDMYNGTVSSVSMSTGRVLKKRYVGSNPNTLALAPDGSALFVSLRGRNHRETYLRAGPEYGKVVVLDAETLDISDWVWGRNQPTGLAVAPDGGFLVFTDFLDNSLEVYRLRPGDDQ